MASLLPHKPSLLDLARAHDLFLANEPRDIFYRAATELVGLAARGQTSLTVAEALVVLLQTWNRSFYQYHQKFDIRHLQDIEALLVKHGSYIASVRYRSIEDFGTEDEGAAEVVFEDFEMVLGPVGAAKALHLLAPRFFPLWDRDIAYGYKLNLRNRGENGSLYITMMLYAQIQSALLGGEKAIGRNPLKAIDEYNYCHITRRWM